MPQENAEAPNLGWQPPDRPDWVLQANEEASAYDLPLLVPLDEVSLLAQVTAKTGLDDFGDTLWQEPFRLLLQSLEEEADLHLFGRLAARSEILNWLENRLRITDLLRRHPEIEEQPVERPTFILGLARSGTTFLQELLAQNPLFRPLLGHEALYPYPAANDQEEKERTLRADRFLTQINRIAPEHATMHAIGGNIPIECGQLLGHSFISDQIAAFYQTPSYAKWIGEHSWDPAYGWHRKILQVLQWQQPERRWLLKAPSHLTHIPEVLRAYPDARFIQTHRDPLRTMTSVTSLLGTLYWAKSDQPFNSSAFEDLMLAPGTATQLEGVMELRDNGTITPDAIFDVRYADLITDPLATVQQLHTWLGLPLGQSTQEAMQRFISTKRSSGHGTHSYRPPSPERIAKDRPLFARYQARYAVADEVSGKTDG